MNPTPQAASRFRRVANLRDRLRSQQSLVLSDRTPFEVIYQQGIVQLRWYPPLQENEIQVGPDRLAVRRDAFAVPLVLVSPLATNTSIYDLFPDRSLVRYLRACGFSVYLIDWGRPDARHDHWNFGTYITELIPEFLNQVRRHSGTRAMSLHGWSFGGMLAYAYTAWSRDPDIRNLVLVGAPCDYHDNGVVGRQQHRIGRLVNRIGRLRALRPHTMPPRLWRSPGWFNSVMYKMTSPVASLKPHLELIRKLHDRELVAAHATNSAFLDDMVVYSGAIIQDVVQHLWANNVLGEGGRPIAGCDAKLSAIEASLLMLSGRIDQTVTASFSQALMKFIYSRDKTFVDVPGGHVAIVSDKQAPAEIWPLVVSWLESRSKLVDR